MKHVMKYLLLLLFSSTLLYSEIPTSRCWWNGIWAEAEFLWWRPTLSDNRVGGSSSSTTFPYINQLYFLEYDWRPGVRATLGMDNVCNGWDLWVTYTYLRPSAQVDLTAASGFLLFSDYLGANFGSGTAAFGYSNSNFLSQKHQFTYQTWEVLTTKWSFVTPCGIFCPYFGLQGLILDQNLSFFTQTGSNALSLNGSLDYSGAGLKGGFDIIYPLGCSFDAFFTPSLFAVYGKKSWNVAGDGVTNADAPEPVDFSGGGKTHQLLPGFDIQLGLGYATTFCGKLIGAKAGWEFLQWSNVPQINRLNTSDDSLTLGFQGLFVSGFLIF